MAEVAGPRLEAQPREFLTTTSIKELHRVSVERGEPLIDPIDDEAFTNWSYQLRLGQSYTSGSKKHSAKSRDLVTIEPGEFALLLTRERVRIPLTHAAFISMRFRHASLKGLVNISGFHVDPGYKGKLLFSVYNAGPQPVTLRHGDKLFMIIFAALDQEAEPREGSNEAEITPEYMDLLRGPPISLVGLGERVHKLEDRATLLLGLLAALIGGLLLAFARGLIHI